MEQICERFPGWRCQIEQLYPEDENFREVCQDYLELYSLLSIWTASSDFRRETIQGYRTLLKELEAELVDILLARFSHLEPPPPAMAAKGDVATQAEEGTPGGERQAEPQGQTTPNITNHSECIKKGGNAIPQTDE